MKSRILTFILAALIGLNLQPSHAQQPKNQGLVAYSVTGVNAKSTGATTIFTTEGERFHPLFVVAEITAASALTIGATVSVGTNSTSFNNIMAASVTGTTLNNMLPNALSALTDSVAPGTAVKVNVSVGAVGTSGTMSVTVIGFYSN
jgi:hypothetical protein